MRKVRAGVVGAGFIGPAHIEALRRLGYVDVVAIADVNFDTARQKAQQLSISIVYDDYKELLGDNSIEVVHICTPNHLHYPMVKDALLAGKHVVCEKPLALNMKEGKELVELAKKSGLVAAVHLNSRFYPLVQHIKEMIAADELGEILAINGSYQQDWLLYETDYNWRIEPEFTGETRALADIGSHWMDTIEYITGRKISDVCADMAIFHPVRKKPLKEIETFTGKMLKSTDYEDVKISTEDYASVLLRFDNGAHGSVSVSQVAAGRKNRMYFEIYGTKSAVAWDGEKPNELWIGKRDGNNEQLIKDPSLMHEHSRQYASYPGGHAEGFPDTSKQLFNNVYKCIISNDKNAKFDFPSFQDGYRVLKLCHCIITSAKEEKWVKVD